MRYMRCLTGIYVSSYFKRQHRLRDSKLVLVFLSQLPDGVNVISKDTG